MPIITDKATRARLAGLYDAEVAATAATRRASDELAELRSRSTALKARLAQEKRFVTPKPTYAPALVDALANDPNAVLDDDTIEAEIEAHALTTRAERKRAAAVRTLQAAIDHVAPLIDAAERRRGDADRERSTAGEALAVAVYDTLLDVAAERMKALASEVLLPIKRMADYERRGGFDRDFRLQLRRLITVENNGVGGTKLPVEETYFDGRNAFDQARQIDLAAVIAQLAGKAA